MIILARKLSYDIRFPEVVGKVVRALPFEKDLAKKVNPNASLFIKGFGLDWTHKELY